jgi:hypothetical protein
MPIPPDTRLTELGIELPELLPVIGSYPLAKRHGDTVYVAGLASLRAEIGSLDSVHSILKVFGMVDAAPGFVDEAKVLDGCTDQLVAVFGEETAIPARVAIGVAELPLGAAVETEMIVAIDVV